MNSVIVGCIVLGLIALAVWKLRPRQIPDAGYEERLGDYNRSCRAVKLDYRDGKLSAEEARKRLEEIGDKYGIPQQRRTKSLGAIQFRQ